MMNLDTNPTPTLTSSGPRPLVRHAKRSAWGRALVLWERGDKRACLFEDGRLRVFMRPYFSLLEPAARPDPELRADLRARAIRDGLDMDTRLAGRGRGRGAALVPTVADQIVVFEGLYPAGFHGDAWTDAHRTRAGRRVKKLRDPAIADAATALARAPLESAIDDGRPGDVVAAIVDVLQRTNLVTRRQLDPLRSLEANGPIARAWVEFLHDTNPRRATQRLRVELAHRGLSKLPWPLLTAPRALLHPQDHMCVRPTILRRQAKSVMPTFRLGAQPSADDYSRCLEIAMAVQAELQRRRFAPRDLFDVTAFMRCTLAPKHGDALRLAMSRRLAVEDPAAPIRALSRAEPS